MKVSEYIEAMNNLLNSITEELEGCVLVAANALSNSVAQRVQKTGTDKNGAPYKKYSVGYAAYRQQLGKQVTHRSLYFTGEMWNSFKPKRTGTLECTVGFNNIETYKRAQYNANIIGEFVQPSQKEVELAVEAFNEQLQKVVEKYMI